jgi:hypothetical protein
LKKAIQAGSSAVLLPIFAITTLTVGLFEAVEAKEQPVTDLPPITVIANKSTNVSTKETAGREWHDNVDPTVVREKDGSYTVSSTTNAYNLKRLLTSLGGPKLNIDLHYASGSVSMTAEGNLTMSVLLESLKYLNEGGTIYLMPTMGSVTQKSKQLMNRRLEVLKNVFERTPEVKLKVMPAKVFRVGEKPLARSDTWRVQICLVGTN